MIQLVVVLILALFVNPAFAYSPEGTLFTLEGKDAGTSEECFLFVIEVGFTGPAQTPDQWYSQILTSYSHDHDSPEPITVRQHPTRPDVLLGTGANGQDEIAIFVNPGILDLKNAKSYNLKWLHNGHLHTNRCLNLRVL